MKDNINIEENKQRIKNFVQSEPIQLIQLNKIMLTESIHMNAKIQFDKQIEKLKSKNITMLTNPIIIKDIGIDGYSLIMGYRGYSIAKGLNHEYIPAIIINEHRKAFIKRIGFNNSNFKRLPINEIIIPESFLKNRVTDRKVKKVLDYYNKHGRFDKIVLIREDGLLIDGYARYVGAKILGLDSVPVRYVL